MPIVRLIAEGVGPFEKLDLDFSDGNGNPHPGPHILAGVNGAGKSTILRALAWVLETTGSFGFDYEEWRHKLAGHGVSRALLLVSPPTFAPYVLARSGDRTASNDQIAAWAKSSLVGAGVSFIPGEILFPGGQDGVYISSVGERTPLPAKTFNFAAYAPSRALKYLERPDLTKTPPVPEQGALAFETTVQNDAIQSWLAVLFSKQAIAPRLGRPSDAYDVLLKGLDSALSEIYDQKVHLDVDLDPAVHPCLQMGGKRLNFSQLADGVRNTLGLLSDLTMRIESMGWQAGLNGKRPGLLLIDEIDAHLHPHWQRQILRAIRKALPDAQIIVTTHSPFVISSCRGARVHVLDVDEHGKAQAQPPRDAPFGQSVTATLKGIFDVDSRFDVQTERELREWNELKRQEAVGRLSPKDKKRLQQLTDMLSERSEELRLIVGIPPKLSSLLGVLEGGKTAKRRSQQRSVR